MLCLHFSFMITLFPCSSMGPLSWDAIVPEVILCGLPTGSSSSTTAPIWVCTMGSIHQEQRAPAWVPQGRQLPTDPLLPCGFLSIGCRSGLEYNPAGPLHGLHTPQATSTSSTMGLSTVCRRTVLCPSSLTWLVSYSSLSLVLVCSRIFPFLNVLSQRYNQHCSLAWLWPVVGAF